MIDIIKIIHAGSYRVFCSLDIAPRLFQQLFDLLSNSFSLLFQYSIYARYGRSNDSSGVYGESVSGYGGCFGSLGGPALNLIYSMSEPTGSMGSFYVATNGALHYHDGASWLHLIGSLTWAAPTLTNNWVSYGNGYASPAYTKDNDGVVRLKGVICNGTIGAVAFVLPTGYRPATAVSLGTISNDHIGKVVIATNGNVSILSPSTNEWITLDGLTFSTN